MSGVGRAQSIPLKIAFRRHRPCRPGRYYRKGPRRRPIRTGFCDADVLDVFDEWRRAAGTQRVGPEATAGGRRPRIQRAVLRPAAASEQRNLGDAFDALIDRGGANWTLPGRRAAASGETRSRALPRTG